MTLPRSCKPVPRIEIDSYDWYARHERKVRECASQEWHVLFLGDSITHFWGEDGDLGEGLWRERFAGKAVLNLGFGFDRTQNVLYRLQHGEFPTHPPRLIVLNIGTNQFSITQNYSGDTPEDTALGILCVVHCLRKLAPTTRLVVTALFPRGGKNAEIAEANAILHRELKPFPGITLLDLTAQLGDTSGAPLPALFQNDLCHPRRAVYELWLAALAPHLAEAGV